MKRNILLFTGLFSFSKLSVAATGSANDDLYFVLAFLGFLVVVLLLITGADYLKRDGRKLLSNIQVQLHHWVADLKKLLAKPRDLKLQNSVLPAEPILRSH